MRLTDYLSQKQGVVRRNMELLFTPDRAYNSGEIIQFKVPKGVWDFSSLVWAFTAVSGAGNFCRNIEGIIRQINITFDQLDKRIELPRYNDYFMTAVEPYISTSKQQMRQMYSHGAFKTSASVGQTTPLLVRDWIGAIADLGVIDTRKTGQVSIEIVLEDRNAVSGSGTDWSVQDNYIYMDQMDVPHDVLAEMEGLEFTIPFHYWRFAEQNIYSRQGSVEVWSPSDNIVRLIGTVLDEANMSGASAKNYNYDYWQISRFIYPARSQASAWFSVNDRDYPEWKPTAGRDWLALTLNAAKAESLPSILLNASSTSGTTAWSQGMFAAMMKINSDYLGLVRKEGEPFRLRFNWLDVAASGSQRLFLWAECIGRLEIGQKGAEIVL